MGRTSLGDKRANCSCDSQLWTDAKSREFIATEYPWFLATFDNYSQPIQRADAIRYFVLNHFGGIYIDLDDVSLIPLSLPRQHLKNLKLTRKSPGLQPPPRSPPLLPLLGPPHPPHRHIQRRHGLHPAPPLLHPRNRIPHPLQPQLETPLHNSHVQHRPALPLRHLAGIQTRPPERGREYLRFCRELGAMEWVGGNEGEGLDGR